MTVTLDRPGPPGLDVEDSVRRREFIVGALALAGLSSAGCGGSDRSASDDAAPSRSTTQDDGPPSGLPGRVVALDPFLTLPTLTKLAVDVIAVFANGSFPAWLPAEMTAEVVDLGGYATANLEHLAVLAPDTLVGLDQTVGALPAEINQIAPIVTIPSTGANGGWRDGMRALAELAGQKGALDDIIAALDDRAAGVADQVGASGVGSAALVRVRPDEVRLHGANHFGGSLLADCGLVLPAGAPTAANRDEAFVAIGPEALEVIDSDAIFVLVGGGGQDQAAAENALDTLTANPLWGRIPAVADDRAYFVGEHWGTGEVNAAGLVIDDIVRSLELT